MPRMANLSAIALALVSATASAGASGPLRGEATPSEAREVGQTGGVAVLRAPSSAEVLIRGGEFTMGSPPTEVIAAKEACKAEFGGDLCEDIPFQQQLFYGSNRDLESLLANELDEHPVSLSPYWIDRREVTVREYRRCAEVGACRMPEELSAGAQRYAKPDLPIVFVSWDEASAFCTWRHARLPTEAEWERAARGPNGRRYPWGATYNPGNANHGKLRFDVVSVDRMRMKMPVEDVDDRDGFAELAPVGSFPDGRSVEGIDDLAGNAAEWVSDYFAQKYEAASVRDPKGPEQPPMATAPFRVVRGGSFLHASPWMRASARLVALPSYRQEWLGFRCARDGS